MHDCSVDVATRVLEGIEVDGSIARLAVPVSSLDPTGVRFWVRNVLGDRHLASRMEHVPPTSYSTLMANRRAQCERMVMGRRTVATG